jgi:hypothetical protein
MRVLKAAACLLLLAPSGARAATPALSAASAAAIQKEWHDSLLRLRPELADLIEATEVRLVPPDEYARLTSRPDVEGTYDWDNHRVYVNRDVVAGILADAAAKSPDADQAAAWLSLHIVDHELAGHADAVRRLEAAAGRYSGMVLEEELTAFSVEAEGIVRSYRDPVIRRGLSGVAGLASLRHKEILATIPRGVEGFERLLRARRYTLPTVSAKAKEYRDYAAVIERAQRMMGRTPAEIGDDPAIKRARENADSLEKFYGAERGRLATMLARLKIEPLTP